MFEVFILLEVLMYKSCKAIWRRIKRIKYSCHRQFTECDYHHHHSHHYHHHEHHNHYHHHHHEQLVMVWEGLNSARLAIFYNQQLPDSSLLSETMTMIIFMITTMTMMMMMILTMIITVMVTIMTITTNLAIFYNKELPDSYSSLLITNIVRKFGNGSDPDLFQNTTFVRLLI